MIDQRMKFITVFIALAAMLTTLAVSAAPGDKDKGGPPDWSQQWYLRLSVVAPDEDSISDRGNVIGQLDDSEDGYDSHDLIELNPFASPYLTLVFPHEDWPEPGNYGSDYHATAYEEPDQWVFHVLSDDNYRTITLYWNPVTLVPRDPAPGTTGRSNSPKMDSAENLAERMWLEDADTGDRVSPWIPVNCKVTRSTWTARRSVPSAGFSVTATAARQSKARPCATRRARSTCPIRPKARRNGFTACRPPSAASERSTDHETSIYNHK